MWAARQAPQTRGEWIRAALADDDHREQVVLAAGLSADVASELIETARQAADPAARSRGLLWAADATVGGAQPTAESLADLIDALAQAAASPRTGGTQPPADVTALDENTLRPGWPYVLRIAMLPLPDTLRPRRDRVLGELELDDDERPLAAAHAALADAGIDACDSLEPGQEDAVRAPDPADSRTGPSACRVRVTTGAQRSRRPAGRTPSRPSPGRRAGGQVRRAARPGCRSRDLPGRPPRVPARLHPHRRANDRARIPRSRTAAPVRENDPIRPRNAGPVGRLGIILHGCGRSGNAPHADRRRTMAIPGPRDPGRRS